MSELRTIEEVAATSGLPPERLRTWCATGELRCERDTRGWLIDDAEMAPLERLAGSRRDVSNGTRAVALAVPAHRAADDVLAEVARRASIAPDDVFRARLSVDGMDYAVISWPSIGDDGPAVVVDLAASLGGVVLLDEAASRQSPGKIRFSTA